MWSRKSKEIWKRAAINARQRNPSNFLLPERKKGGLIQGPLNDSGGQYGTPEGQLQHPASPAIRQYCEDKFKFIPLENN
jgi:hypothetical protein